MLFKPWHLAGIADGTIDRAYRRWEKPRVRVGTRMRTPIGVLEVTAVDKINKVTARDAKHAGYASVSDLERDLGTRPGDLYRVMLRVAGPDERIGLRTTIPSDGEIDRLVERLAAMDRASRRPPWTTDVLRAIGDSPGVRAPDLAARFGRETRLFKADVRRLKELGLTESLPVGYRLSPRGEAVLAGADR